MAFFMTRLMTRLWAGLALAMLAAFMWAVAIILSKITLETTPSNTVFVVQLVADGPRPRTARHAGPRHRHRSPKRDVASARPTSLRRDEPRADILY